MMPADADADADGDACALYVAITRTVLQHDVAATLDTVQGILELPQLTWSSEQVCGRPGRRAADSLR